MKFKLTKRSKRFKKQNLWSHINFYWELAICMMFALILLSFFLSYFLYYKIKTPAEISDDDIMIESRIIKRERIQKTLDYFEKRKERSQEILYTDPPAIDPSL